MSQHNQIPQTIVKDTDKATTQPINKCLPLLVHKDLLVYITGHLHPAKQALWGEQT